MADFNPDTYIAEKTAPASGGFDPDAYIAEKTAPAPDDTPAIIKAGKNIWSGIKKSSADADAQKTMPEYLLHMVGGAAGNLMNIPVEAAKAAYSYVPQAVKTPIESEVKGVGEAVKSNKTLSDFLLGAQQWAKDNPRALGNIGAAVNVASVLPVGKAVEAAGKGIADVAGPAVEKAAAAIVDKIPTATDKLDKAIQTGVTKGIKPTVIGKPSYNKLTNFYDKANQAVKVIAKNREKLNLVDENGEALHHPRSAAETLQAIDQTEKVIYDKYHAMATAAGDAGSEFDTEPILKELDKIAADPEEALPMGDPRLKYNPQTRAYANDLKSEIMELHGASPEIIEARIADLNNSLKGFYDGRVTKAKAQIDGSVAKLMRQQLDNNITSAVGEGYQDLKNQYGALKAIENEVAKRALVNARKANKGVADLTDIFTGGDLVAGTLSGNPALIAKGLFGRGIKEVYKSLNNPDRYIEKMFKKAYEVVPSGKDVELVKNAVAGVKPLPGPDADNPFYDLPKTKKEADAIMKSSASPGDVPAEHYTMGNFEDLETPEDFQMRKAVEAGYKPDVPGAQAPIDNSKFKMQLKNDFFPGTKAGKDINFADLSPAKQVQINKRVAGINTDPDRLQNFVEQGLIKQGEEIHPDDIVQWANEAGKVELKPKKLFGGLFDNMRPGSIGSALGIKPKVDNLGFYSNAEKAVNEINMPKAPADQWAAMLDPAKGKGTKADEMKWIGLDDFLKEKGNQSVTKQEIQDFIDQNKIKLVEVRKGGKATFEEVKEQFKPQIESLKESGINVYKDENGYVSFNRGQVKYSDIEDMISSGVDDQSIREAKEIENVSRGGQKFSSYQTPGGSNYRELLMTLPHEKRPPMSYEQWIKTSGYDGMENSSPTMKETLKQKYNEYATQENWSGKASLKGRDDVYMSPHWDELNPVAHVRVNDRTDAEGKKVLFAEELQSDWHQEGRKKGYVPDKKEYDATKKQLDDLVTQERTPENQKKIDDLGSKLNNMDDAKNAGVPAAPFSKTWHELAFKRILREAAEKGYDRVAWTTGEQQAARYDLTKHIGKAIWNEDTKMLTAYDPAMEKTVLQVDIKSPQELENYIGKDAAQKLIDAKPDTEMDRTISGLDLKVGGEGMKGFYDKIIPDYANKYGKKWGSKVSDDKLSTGEIVHSMDITPAMRKSVMEEGQPIGAVSAKVLPMLGLTGATAGAIGAGGVTLEKVLHKKDEHGQSFADILKGIVDNMQGGK